jgi:hypothetical protein
VSRRLQITVSERQYERLRELSERSSVSVAELIRRAIDIRYAGQGRVRAAGVDVTLGVWRPNGVPVAGRRAGVRLDP